MRHKLKLLSVLSLIVSIPLFAGSLTLSSQDIAQGKFMPKAQEFNGFGCSGGGRSQLLKWSGAPKGTKSYAITTYDLDAPGGNGWWHWQVVNIPRTIMEISTAAGNMKTNRSPTGSEQIKTILAAEVLVWHAHLEVMAYITIALR